MTKQIVSFNNHNIELIQHNNQNYMTKDQIGLALEYADTDKVSHLYNAHKSEFNEDMTCLIKHGRTRVRIFNREGAWLIGMFARTPKAAEFRKWVLKVLGAVADNKITVNNGTVEVAPYTRRLPSAPREIVLSEKAKTEIGGIVKTCTAAVLKEVFAGLNKPEPLKLCKATNGKMDEKLLKLSETIVEYGRSQYKEGMIHGILEGFFEGTKKN